MGETERKGEVAEAKREVRGGVGTDGLGSSDGTGESGAAWWRKGFLGGTGAAGKKEEGGGRVSELGWVGGLKLGCGVELWNEESWEGWRRGGGGVGGGVVCERERGSGEAVERVRPESSRAGRGFSSGTVRSQLERGYTERGYRTRGGKLRVCNVAMYKRRRPFG